MFLYHLSMEKYHYVLLTIFDILKYLDLIYGHEIEMYTVEQGEKRDKRQ